MVTTNGHKQHEFILYNSYSLYWCLLVFIRGCLSRSVFSFSVSLCLCGHIFSCDAVATCFNNPGYYIMIVTRKKDIAVVKELLAGRKNLVIVGCAECAAVCRTGGSEQVKEMAEALSDWNILATISIQSPCDKRISARDMKRIAEEVEGADAILALTCGSGVQALDEVTGKPVIAALDTHFLGMVERLGRFYERCSHCGDCIINDMGGICGVTLCPKGVRNGPCEGINGIKCEVYPEKDCVWHTIYERLRSRGMESLFLNYHGPVDWEKNHAPGEEVW